MYNSHDVSIDVTIWGTFSISAEDARIRPPERETEALAAGARNTFVVDDPMIGLMFLFEGAGATEGTVRITVIGGRC